jgi:cysteine-rich CPXCG protein
MLTGTVIHCPYCGEPIELCVDASAGDQDYIEDCQVCCRPISIALHHGEGGAPRIRARSENEA